MAFDLVISFFNNLVQVNQPYSDYYTDFLIPTLEL